MDNVLRKICLWASLVWVVLYIRFAWGQYTEFFYEAQFLHIDFIRDMVNGVFDPKHFFTTYGEHLFPGYNLLLYINYKLFHLTGLFELMISVLTSCLVALLLCKVILPEKRCWWLPFIVVGIVLSPVQNIMWGMALASHVSTFLLVLMMYLIYFKPNSSYQCLWISVLVPVYVIFFAGAYAIGFIMVVALICAFSDFQKDKKMLVALITSSIFSYVAYYLLLSQYGSGLEHSAMGYRYNPLSIGGFIDLMLGSSLLGKAFFEKYPTLTLYYVAGFYVVCMLFMVFSMTLSQFKTKLKSTDKFFIALCVYALVNVVVVAIARNTNGPEGALGQWYQTHLKFIPLTIAYFLSLPHIQSKVYRVIRMMCLMLLVVFLSLGYVREYIKGPYVDGWKAHINATIPKHLMNPQYFLDSKDPDPLSWDAKGVSEGLMVLYRHNLSYFRQDRPIYSVGLTQDGWLEKTDERYFDIICPAHSRSVVIQWDHMNPDNASLIKKLHIKHQNEMYQITSLLSQDIKHFRLDTSQFKPYQSENLADLRVLIFHVRQIHCIA